MGNFYTDFGLCEYSLSAENPQGEWTTPKEYHNFLMTNFIKTLGGELKSGFTNFIDIKRTHNLVVFADGFDITIMMQLSDDIDGYVHWNAGLFHYGNGCFCMNKAQQYLSLILPDFKH
jgi:hypothetical protein